jgi:nucleoside phosphorylase
MDDAPGGRAPIAVICALEEELGHLRPALAPAEAVWHGARRVWLTALGDQPVVLALCGVGMLSAAAVTETVIGRCAPAAVLNFGCAGAHRPDLLPGDLIVGARVVAYDRGHVRADGSERYSRMHYLARGEPQRAETLPAAPELLARVLALAPDLLPRLEPWPGGAAWPAGVPVRPPRLVVGTVASADRWNSAAARIQTLVERHDSHCEDMEAAAIALTCASHAVPFLTIKDISNNDLLRPSGEGFMADTAGQLGRRAAALTLALLRDLADE